MLNGRVFEPEETTRHGVYPSKSTEADAGSSIVPPFTVSQEYVLSNSR